MNIPDGYQLDSTPQLPQGYQLDSGSSPPRAAFGSNRGVSPVTNPDVATDMMKSLVGGAAKGSVYMLPNMINNAFAGPQEVYHGLAVNNKDNFQPWVPYPMSSLPDMLQPHEPQTPAGTGMDFLGQILGGMGGQKLAESPNMQEFVGSESSGGQPKFQPPGVDATPEEKLSAALNSAQSKTRFSGAPNPLEAGQEANQALSHQYGVDTALQRQHYQDLNQIGNKFSMPANEVYSKGNGLIGSLKGQVAPESYENTALGNLQDIMDNLSAKNGIKGTPDKTIQMPSWKIPLTQKGEAGQAAYGMQPSDAVDIKTTLNQLARSGKFTNSGQTKILEFKNYIQNFLDQAKSVSPEFGGALDKAETQAARVSLYRDPKLTALWKPKPDYMSYKGETDTPPETFDRMANFMGKLNSGSPAAGESYALANILPHEQAVDIFKNALLQNKQAPEGIWGNIKGGFGIPGFIGASPKSPLLDLASQLRGGS